MDKLNGLNGLGFNHGKIEIKKKEKEEHELLFDGISDKKDKKELGLNLDELIDKLTDKHSNQKIKYEPISASKDEIMSIYSSILGSILGSMSIDYDLMKKFVMGPVVKNPAVAALQALFKNSKGEWNEKLFKQIAGKDNIISFGEFEKLFKKPPIEKPLIDVSGKILPPKVQPEEIKKPPIV